MVLGRKLSNGEDKRVDKTLYKEMVGSIMYATTMHPNIIHNITQVRPFMENSKNFHLQAV